MNESLLNKCIFATFSPACNHEELKGCLGFYGFRLLQADANGRPDNVLIYGVYVARQFGRVMMFPDGGDPPSARAGLSLDLHQAATARIRDDSAKIKKPVAYYIDDAGKLAATSWEAFEHDRAPLVLAEAGPLAAFDHMALYNRLTGRAAVSSPASPPAPPFPSM